MVEFHRQHTQKELEQKKLAQYRSPSLYRQFHEEHPLLAVGVKGRL